MRLKAGIPIVFSIASFILVFLALYAGRDPGFMEDYHIAVFNTSEFGKNLVPTPTTGDGQASATACGPFGGAIGSLCASATAAVGSAVASAEAAVASELSSIADDIADELTSKLGIKDFYSVHVMDLCEGYYTPEPTATNATYNVTSCTPPMATGHFNISALIDTELQIGPLNIDLATLGISSDLQGELDKIPKLLLALSILFIIAVAFTGLSMILSTVAFLVLPAFASPIEISNILVAIIAFLLLLAGCLGTTIGVKMAVDKVNDFGEDFGLSASVGKKFLALVWSAFALMVLTTAFWIFEFVRDRRSRRQRYDREKRWKGRSSLES